MKHDLKLLFALITALGLPVAGHAAEILTQAQITQIIKDVKTIDPGKEARPAVMKETLKGEQAVRTGIESRAELLFNDHTITRLGANTHFSFTEGTRNMSLQSGVMLLQVPKGIGGAKIETAAVTAAVTGTTIMIEAGKSYTKIIVLEGELWTWTRGDKKGHGTRLTAGQELILPNGSKKIPNPVYVNLKLLEGSSLLLTGNWGSPLNFVFINAAVAGQGSKDYIPTNLAIIGAGTDVTVIQGQAPNNPPPPGSPGAPPTTPPPSKYGALTTIPGNTTIGANSTINTDPKIINGGVASYGRIYRGTILDGPPTQYLFGAGTTVSFPGYLNVDSDFPDYGYAVFKFGSLTINSMPAFQTSGNGATQMALVSLGDITISSATPTTLDFTNILSEFDLFTAGGNIDIGPNITITGLDRVELYSYGAGHNVTIDGEVDANDKFLVTTQGSFSGNGTINAQNVTIQAGGSYSGAETINAGEITIQAGGSFGGTGSLSAESISIQAAGIVSLDESIDEGDNQTDAVNGVALDLNPLFQLSLTGNTVNITNGFTYPGEGPSDTDVDLTLTAHSNGGDQPGNITLSGNIIVSSITANADNNFTADSSSTLTADNDISITTGGKVEIDGGLSATSLEIMAGGDVTTGSNANFNINTVEEGEDGPFIDGTAQITSTGGDVTLDGNISAAELDVSGNNVTILNTIVESSMNIGGLFQITTSGSVQIEGTIFASDLNVTQSSGVLVTTPATINADTIELNTSGSVEIDGVIEGQDGSATSFTSTSTGAQGAEDPTTQDFFGTGSIDAETITINSQGDLILVSPVEAGSPTVNGVAINPNEGLTELDLTGATIEVTNGYSLSDSTLKLTSTNGDISITGGISVGVNGTTPSQLIINASGNIDLIGGPTVTADTLSLSAQQITASSAVLAGNNTTLNVSNADLSMGQDGGGSNIFFINETATDGTSPVGSMEIFLTGSNSTINLSANSLIIDSNISGPAGLSLSLISAGDINGDGSSATISGVSSLTLQVGVSATLTGDGNSNVYYDNTALFPPDGSDQLIIGTSGLSTLSVTASSIVVGSGFPSTPSTSLNLTASGVNEDTGGISVNTDLAIASGSFIADSGTINLNGTVTTGSGGSLTITANSGDVIVNDALTTGTGGSLTITASGTLIVSAPLTTGSGGNLTLNANGSGLDLENTVRTGGDLNVTASGTLTVGVLLTTGSGHTLSLTSNNGDITANGSLESGGDLNLTATTGSIYINNFVSAGGNFTAMAGTDIIISELADPNIGGFVNLNAGGAIEVDQDLTISGSLILNAGTYIHTASFANAEIFGATSVTLTLGASAEISETIVGGTSTLFFEVPSGTEQAGFVPLAIDLTQVISNDSFVSATATSLTLTSDFNEPNISLILESSDGSLVLNGVVTVSNFTGYAFGGPFTINDAVNTSSFYAYSDSGALTLNGPLTATSYADFYAYGGNLVINGSATTPSFYGYSANMITGTGSITAGTVTLQQSGSATATVSGSANLLSFNTLGVILISPNESATSLTISANPLTLTSALTLPGVDLILSGVLNTQGHTITALNVTLQNLQTTNAASGNATNLDINAYSLTLSNVSLNGIASGSGGTLTGTTSSGTAGPGIVPAEINLDANDVIVNGAVTANGGPSGGNGGTISLNALDNVNVNSGPVTANGGNGSATGGSGGSITLTSGGNINAYSSINANGGNGGAAGGVGGTINLTSSGSTNINSSISITANGGNGGSGGSGGSVNILTTSASDITVSSPITALGGDAGPASGAAGGNGGSVSLISGGNITLNLGGDIAATSGENGNTKWTGGNGGSVTLTAQGAVVISSIIEVSSSDLFHNRVSARGGNIHVTSHATTGNVAINITDSGQLNALLNQAATGPGGSITFIADKGGSIAVSGSVRADRGNIIAQTGTADGTGPGGPVTLNGANLSADVVKVGSLGSNGSLTIGNSHINGDTAIMLYAAGSNGNVTFVGNTFLSGAGFKTIAGNTVTINPGVFVNVVGGAATVYTNNPDYNGGGNGTGHVNGSDQLLGSFTGNSNTTTRPFASRPAF